MVKRSTLFGIPLQQIWQFGNTGEFASAFRIAERAGLRLVPHGGELLGPEHIRTCLDALHAQRLGHGVRAAEDPVLLSSKSSSSSNSSSV